MSIESQLIDYRNNYGLDLYDLDECLIFIKSIGESSDKINKTPYNLALAKIQRQLINNLILLVAKFFDEPSKKYPTVSMLSIIELIEKGKEDSELEDKLDYFKKEIESNTKSIQEIKNRRDKIIAHNEIIDIENFEALKWGEINSLIEIIKEFEKFVSNNVLKKPSYSEGASDQGSVSQSFDEIINKLTE